MGSSIPNINHLELKEMIAISQLRKKCNIMQMNPVSFVKTTSCTIMID